MGKTDSTKGKIFFFCQVNIELVGEKQRHKLKYLPLTSCPRLHPGSASSPVPQPPYPEWHRWMGNGVSDLPLRAPLCCSFLLTPFLCSSMRSLVGCSLGTCSVQCYTGWGNYFFCHWPLFYMEEVELGSFECYSGEIILKTSELSPWLVNICINICQLS